MPLIETRKKVLLDSIPPEFNKPVTIISRTQWGALPPKSEESLELPVYKVLVSHTQTDPCYNEQDCIRLVQNLQRAHMRLGDPDIRYNFVVGSDGRLYEGRGWKIKPSKHPFFPRLDRFSIEISHTGKIGIQSKLEEIIPRLQLIRFGQKNGYIIEEPEYQFDAY